MLLPAVAVAGGGRPVGWTEASRRCPEPPRMRPEEDHRWHTGGTAKAGCGALFVDHVLPHLFQPFDGHGAAHRKRYQADHHEQQRGERLAALLLVGVRAVRHCLSQLEMWGMCEMEGPVTCTL